MAKGDARNDFDFTTTFGDDYLYFFAERLCDERSESEAKTITSLLGLKAGEHVADVACGHGRISNRLARDGMVVRGVDTEARYLDLARSQATRWGVDASYEEGDMRALPWADSTFDAALIWATSFAYFSDDENSIVLQELGRVLRPGGRVLVETFSKDFVVHGPDSCG